MKIFVSYARLNRDSADALVRDLHALGHQAFYDKDLTGGQRWWDTLLDQITAADIFLPVLSDEYRESEACRAEAEWANALDVPFLPATVVPQLAGMYHPMIAETNWVSYDPTDRAALAALARAVGAMPLTARPAPLPRHPAIPMSYLVQVEQEIRTSEDMARQRQLSIVSNLRSKLGGREASGARELLAALRERPDVTFEIAMTIDNLLAKRVDEVSPDPHLMNNLPTSPVKHSTIRTSATIPIASDKDVDLAAHGGSSTGAVSSPAPVEESPNVDEGRPRTPTPAALRDERPPRTKADPDTSELSLIGRGRRHAAEILVFVGGGLVFLSLSVVPWAYYAYSTFADRRWALFADFLVDPVGRNALNSHYSQRWLVWTLLSLLLVAVNVIATLTLIRPVPTLVRIVGCIISALVAVSGFVEATSDSDWLIAAGPVVLTVGLALLTVVLIAPHIGARLDAEQEPGPGPDEGPDVEEVGSHMNP